MLIRRYFLGGFDMGADKQRGANSARNRRRAAERRRKRMLRRRVLLTVFFVFFMVFVVSMGLFLYSWVKARGENRAFEELVELKTASVAQTASETERTEQTEDGKEGSDRDPLAAFYEKNSDFIGWLSVPGTRINYPVMLTSDDPEYYIDHDFNKNSSKSGVPFMGEGCAPDSDNIIIYGHNMKNGTMFADLIKYRDESFWEENKSIFFETAAGTAEYEIIAAFQEEVHYQNETDVFKYYNYGGTLTEERFNDYIENIKKLSLYDTKKESAYGDQIITLSTCSYHKDNGRFVVVARRIS